MSNNKLDRDRLEKVTSKENIQEVMVKVNEIFLNTTEMEAETSCNLLQLQKKIYLSTRL